MYFSARDAGRGRVDLRLTHDQVRCTKCYIISLFFLLYIYISSYIFIYIYMYIYIHTYKYVGRAKKESLKRF